MSDAEAKRAMAREATRRHRARIKADPEREAAFRARAAELRRLNIEKVRERDRLAKQRKRAADPEAEKVKATEWRQANPDKVRGYNQKQWERAKQTPALIEKHRARGRVDNMPLEKVLEKRVKARVSAKEARERRKAMGLSSRTDNRSRPRYLLDYRCYRALRELLFTGHMGRLTTQRSIPYDSLQLVGHIGALLPEAGLLWSGYGEVWNIDHIVPVSKFVYETDQDDGFRECWSLSNLRPMLITHNRQRGNRPDGSWSAIE